MKKLIFYSVIIIPSIILYGVTLFLLFKFIFFLGQSNALAQFILSDENLCIYRNTMAAKIIAEISNATCVTVLLNRNHIRYKVGNITIDETCRKQCNNMSYYSFTWCIFNNSMKLLSYKYLK